MWPAYDRDETVVDVHADTGGCCDAIVETALHVGAIEPTCSTVCWPLVTNDPARVVAGRCYIRTHVVYLPKYTSPNSTCFHLLRMPGESDYYYGGFWNSAEAAVRDHHIVITQSLYCLVLYIYICCFTFEGTGQILGCYTQSVTTRQTIRQITSNEEGFRQTYVWCFIVEYRGMSRSRAVYFRSWTESWTVVPYKPRNIEIYVKPLKCWLSFQQNINWYSSV